MRRIPFFKEREMNDAGMLEVVNCMSLKSIPEGNFVFEYGELGEEFFLILEGKVEIQIPDKENLGRYDQVRFELSTKLESVEAALLDI